MSRPIPGSHASRLLRAGYERVGELPGAPDELASDLNVPRDTALSILRAVAASSSTLAAVPLSKLLAAPTITTALPPIERLLGEDKVHVLNVVSPPGGGRERVAVSAMRETLHQDANARVLVVDCQGHLGPSVLVNFFPRNAPELARIDVVQTPRILGLELFLTSLPRYLSTNPAIKLVVIASIPGPPALRPPSRQVIMRTLNDLSFQRLVAVVCTSAMQTHFPDGGTFDTSRRPAILRPQLRDWLPSGSHEIVLIPDGRASGYAVLRTAPRGGSRKPGSREAYMVDKQGWIADKTST
ncbi:hypothetical protein EXIGLDRAFT_839466 [Exidia glandulosa HHB12029]|uniref:Uncharacterized protein n=1 Tax=Exidia glandulosa HHB12029 TaxID=1314781 RepID=A0A165F0V6_EXIGL|nr:hypothetical protein EXIGLDRAFT_839466 [Exidia glandulosa HHB12029]